MKKNPFHLLNVPFDASDETVENAYQRLISFHSAQTSPQRAKEIEWAYQCIKNQSDRIRFQLFETPKADIPTLLGPSLTTNNPTTPTTEATLAVLANNLKSYRLTMPDDSGSH